MTYVALLRGINVGGNKKVEMRKLKQTFERLGFEDVSTYINSGNVLFRSASTNQTALTKKIEAAIKTDFKFDVSVLLRNLKEIRAVINALPSSWVNDATMKCDVMFLWKEIDTPSVLKQIPFQKNIEDSKYIRGAILWRIDRDKVSKTRIIKAIIGTKLHQQMTVRNPNTVRKLYALMLEANQRPTASRQSSKK